jgi:hypothetical protein
MRKTLFITILLSFTALVAGPIPAQEHIIYPTKGQSEDQMGKDKYECYSWSKNQTGFDPMDTVKPTEAAPRQQARGSTAGGAARGAFGGAALGAAVGAIAGDVGKGAAMGAAGGGLLGGARRRSQISGDRQRQGQWEREQVANYQRNRDAYNRAYRACLEGRGYSVQ